jgi:predicted RNA-binding Zn-ribbon protein involved in translation (DUF1610 family)
METEEVKEPVKCKECGREIEPGEGYYAFGPFCSECGESKVVLRNMVI